MFPGGIAGKLGNRYEAKWLVRQLLDVIAGKAEWLWFEGITSQFDGFEFAISRDRITEWHQTKVNAPRGNWTIGALKRENVLSAFKNRLAVSVDDRCVFISQDSAKDLRTLVEKLEIPNDLEEFVQALSKDQKDKFDQLIEAWDVDKATAYAWLKRCELKTLPETELDGVITSHSDLCFFSSGSSAFAELRHYAEDRFNKFLTTELVRAEIREGKAGTLVLKDWALDPTLRERLRAETDTYLQTYSPFGAGGAAIPRRQVCEIADQIGQPDGPNVILVTGIAGSGKSGVVRGLIGKLQEVMHLAFRVDHHLDRSTPQEIGRALTGRAGSPVATLKGLEPERPSVLIIDQVDAVSEVSGRSGAVREAVLRMIDDARHFKTVLVVLVCRSFDFDSDPRLKALKEANRVEHIGVPLLEWDSDVAPFLADRGIDPTLLSPAQKELLRLPLHLAVFLEVGSEGQGFTSRNDLFQSLIQKKDRAIRNDRNVPWSIVEPLKVLAGWMSERQRLDAPLAVLDDFPGAQDFLSSENLIIRSGNRVNFFHESFFDYLYARAFVVDDRSVVDLLASTEHHLFRRTQTRQILEALRQDDRGRYFCELASVFTSDAVRYHIKAAVAQWLGSLRDPTEKECDIVLRLDDGRKALRPLVRYALLSSVGWFDRLHGSGWLRAVLNGESDERRQAILRWLSNIAGERPEEVANLLNTWWNHDPVRGKRLLDWFGFARWQKPVPALVALGEKVIRSRPPGFFEERGQPRREIFLLYTTWAEKNPNEGAVILRALFDAWFDAHPGQHPFERDELDDLGMSALGRMAEKAPKAFIAGTIDALSRSIDEINRREATGERDYSFRPRTFSDHRFGADNFLGFFRSALRQIASAEPDTAREFLAKLDASKHGALLHLHLETVSANGEALASHLLALLGSKNLFEAGWNGADWKSFADAARAAFPSLSRDDRHRVENTIFSYQPEIALAIRMAHEIEDHGETEPWLSRNSVIRNLNCSGFERWCILETIGESLLTVAGVQHLKKLRRKFPGEKVPDPNHMGTYAVGSTIKRNRAAHMNDAHWLRAIELKRPLHGELQHATKENPARFVALMKRIPNHADQSYVLHVLRGLAEAEEVEDELLKEAIRNAHDRPGRPYGTDITRIFGKRPQIAKEPSIFAVLAWYVEHGEANEDDTIDTANTEREIVSIEDLMDRGGELHFRGINGPRGLAAEALGAVLWRVPEITERTWGILARRIEREPLISVRCCLIRPLVPLFNSDRRRCAQFVELLVEGRSAISLSPLITHQGTYLLPYLLPWVPDVGRRLLDSLLNSGDETMRMIGAWHVMRHSFQEPAYAPEADRLIEAGKVYRRLAADVASHAITSEECRDRAERQLIRFFNDEDNQVRQQAAEVFRQIEPNEFARFSDLAEAYLASRAFDHDAFAFFHALEQATTSVHALVISAAQQIIANLEVNGATGTTNYVDLHQLQGLLTREYAASENDPELRRRLLDVIDVMLEREMYGADEILKAHERE
jgi:hypothetical protein